MIYVSSACIKKDRISEVIEEYAQNGIKNIELSGGTTYYETIEYDLIALKEKYDLTYSCHAYFPPPEKDFVVNLASCNDEIYEKSKEHYQKCVEMLCRVGIKDLSIHAGFLTEIGVEEIGKSLNRNRTYNEAEAYKRFCQAYEWLKGLCNESDIQLYLENNVLSLENYQNFGGTNLMMMTDSKSIDYMRKTLEFDLLLDMGHLCVSSHTLGFDYNSQCKILAPQAKWIHLSHNNGIADQHRPLCEDSPIVSEYIANSNKKVNVTLETNGSIEEILESIRVLEELGVER